MAAIIESYREQPTLFGPRGALAGVITRPRNAVDPSAPAIVILNTGIVHRVGHNRMYVRLSRTLAESGRVVVRFDLSGIGDSERRNDHATPLLAQLADIREVLDSMEKARLGSRFVLIGLCSGADLGVLYNDMDPRVVGLVLLDPTLPPTPRYYLHYVLQRLGRVRSWLNVFAGRSGLVRLATSQLGNRLRPETDLKMITLQNLQFSPHLVRCYANAASRGLKLLAVFTSLSPRHAYTRQILDAFPEVSAGGSLQLHSFPNSDHVFSSPNDRARLLKLIGAWVDSRWPLLLS